MPIKISEALEQCAQFAENVWAFDSWNERIGRGLHAAYSVYRASRGFEAALLRALTEQPFSQSRKRKLSKRRPALAAVQLALKPETEEHRKRCSDYSAVLIAFECRGIEPDDFLEAFHATTLEKCLAGVRDARREGRSYQKLITDDKAHRTAMRAAANDEPVPGRDEDLSWIAEPQLSPMEASGSAPKASPPALFAEAASAAERLTSPMRPELGLVLEGRTLVSLVLTLQQRNRVRVVLRAAQSNGSYSRLLQKLAAALQVQPGDNDLMAAP